MASSSRFPKCDPARVSAVRRAHEWFDNEFRRALRAQPRPEQRLDMLKFAPRVARSELPELFPPRGPTLH